MCYSGSAIETYYRVKKTINIFLLQGTVLLQILNFSSCHKKGVSQDFSFTTKDFENYLTYEGPMFPHHIETSQLICITNGFHMMGNNGR